MSDGQIVAIPTETVYGLAADATNAEAVASIYAAKSRPAINPLIVHVADINAAQDIAAFSDDALDLAEAFWPGPLTLVLPKHPSATIAGIVSAGLDSIAIRCPAHPAARSLLSAFNRPLAAPSANPSGKITSTSADHVLDGLDGQIAAVLDAGPCELGLESTIVGLTGSAPTLLRPGGLPAEQITDCIGKPLERAKPSATPNAPGQLASHYAPDATIRLEAFEKRPDEHHIGFGSVKGDVSLSPNGDLVEAAARLFDLLHRCDQTGVQKIAVAPIPDSGLGRAINDRLARAAAPRSAV